MTTQRRSPRRFAPTLPPRLTWRTFQQDTLTVLPGSKPVFRLDSVGSASSLSELGVFGDYTVRRIRGRIAGQTLESVSADGYDILYWGVVIASVDAFNTLGAIPDPETDSAPWMAWDVMHISRKVVASPLVMERQLLETKAMRKVNENNQAIVLTIKADLGNDANGVNYIFGGRLLVSHGRQ